MIVSPSAEEWRTIPGFDPAYEVSNLGRVRSHKRRKMRVLKPYVCKTYGRPVVCLQHPGRKVWGVHLLVAFAFLGPRPDGQVVRHLDGVKINNRVENLAYGTYQDNKDDDMRLGNIYQRAITHCPQGHPYSPENTIMWKTSRSCRICARARTRAWRAKQRASRTLARSA